MSLIRTQQTAAVTLTRRFYVGETLTDAAGSVATVSKRLDGTSVVGVPATATHVDTGVYSLLYPGYVDVDTHIVSWTGTFGGSSTTVKDYVEIVGGHYFTIPEMRSMKPALSETGSNSYSTEELVDARLRAEKEVDRICNQAFVRRFTRIKVNGTGTPYLMIPDLDPKLVRAASVTVQTGGSWSVLSQSSLDAIACRPGYVVRGDGNIWPEGFDNVLIEYEYGSDFIPPDLQDAVTLRARNILKGAAKAIPDRTLSYSDADGNIYRLTTPTARKTGIVDIDGVYGGYILDAGGFA